MHDVNQKVAFAILVAMVVYADTRFGMWAMDWLNGFDRTEASARKAAEVAAWRSKELDRSSLSRVKVERGTTGPVWAAKEAVWAAEAAAWASKGLDWADAAAVESARWSVEQSISRGIELGISGIYEKVHECSARSMSYL